jgi:hypothetical protein
MDFILREAIADQYYFIVGHLLFDIDGTAYALAYSSFSINRYCTDVVCALEVAKYDGKFVDWHSSILIDDALFFSRMIDGVQKRNSNLKRGVSQFSSKI